MGTLGCIFAAPNRGSPHFNAFNPPQKVSFPVPGNRARTRDPSKFHFSSTPHTPGSFIFALSLPPVSFIFRRPPHPRKFHSRGFPPTPLGCRPNPMNFHFFCEPAFLNEIPRGPGEGRGSGGPLGRLWDTPARAPGPEDGPSAVCKVALIFQVVDFPGGLTREWRDGPGPGAEMG